MKNEKASRPGLAVVTGASSGIGYELARVFCEHGFDLLLAAEDEAIADKAASLTSKDCKVDFVQVDLRERRGVEELYRRIRALARPVEVLCVNAGVGVGGEFAMNEIEDEVNLVNLNIVSLLRLTKLVVKDMLTEGHGRILFTSSVAAEMPGPYYAVYAASKSFVQSFSEALRHELKGRGVTVTALQPGVTDTNFFQRANMMNTMVSQMKKDDPAKVAEQGYAAVMAGKDHVVAGSVLNSIGVAMAKFLSEKQSAALQARVIKPNSLK